MKQSILLSIIILSYNTKDLTLACLKSLITNYKDQLGKGEFEIIVVDNDSTDGSASVISNFQFPISNFQLIENDKNLGFSKGNNIGAENAKGKYLLFLNSDTEILDDGLIRMADYFEKHNDIGILGGKLLNKDTTPQKSAGKFFSLINVFLMLFGGGKLGILRFSPKEIEEVDWVSGASLMIRSNLFKKLKGFDSNFFMYMEDMELCFRVFKESQKVVFFPEIKLVHKEIGSSNRTFAIVNIYKSLLYFYKKDKSFLEFFLLKSMLKAKALISITIGEIIRNEYLRKTYREALKIENRGWKLENRS